MKTDFEGYGIELEMTELALHEIARRAAEQQSGARGLATVLEQVIYIINLIVIMITMVNCRTNKQTENRYIYLHAYVYVYIYAYICIYICVYMYIFICIYIFIYICLCKEMFIGRKRLRRPATFVTMLS